MSRKNGGKLKAYSNKFYIEVAVSNNLFSFEDRKVKKIVVPSIVEGMIKDLSPGEEYAFIEIDEEGNEACCKGLRNIIVQHEGSRDMVIFDNHNHSFYFAYKHFKSGGLKFDFIHVDQHKDMREPDIYFDEYRNSLFSSFEKFRRDMINTGTKEEREIEANFRSEDKDDIAAFLYTNSVLNVGNFIKPLIKMDIIDNHYCVDSQYSLLEMDKYDLTRNFVLDLDLDFFSEEMDYIDFSEKIRIIRKLIDNASLVLIATSPYFIEFSKCKAVIDILLN